jgi:hypothetical protein
MGIIPENIVPSAEDGEIRPFIKAAEFVTGLTLKVKSFDIVTASDSKYGANEADYLFKEKKLQKGQTIRYTFLQMVAGKPMERIYESKSAGFLFAFNEANPNKDDVVFISKTGENAGTRFKVELKKSTPIIEEIVEEIDPKDIPF